jgi:plastocyanin
LTRRLLALVAATAACSSGDRTAAVHRVTIEGMAFVPAELHARAGDTVVWTNRDVVPHTVTAAGRFDSGVIAGGGEWRLVVEESGTFDYLCSLHPPMKATLTVR